MDSTKCPIPRDVLLEMVKEENRLRTSDEFQRKVAKEEEKGESDGTNSIVKLQVSFLSNKMIKLLKIDWLFLGKHC